MKIDSRSIAWQGVIGTAAIWGAFFLFVSLRRGTHWPVAIPEIPPDPEKHFPGRVGLSVTLAWWSFIRVCLVVEFLVTKSWAMYRRTTMMDGLGLSLILANLGFAGAYSLVIVSQLFDWLPPYWFREYAVGDPLVLVLVIGWILLCKLPDEPEDEQNPTVTTEDTVKYQGPNRRLGPKDRRR